MATGEFDWRVDGSDLTYGERLAHHRNQVGMHDAPPAQQLALERHAHDLATEEMLDEIHGMLRSLVKAMDNKEKSDD